MIKERGWGMLASWHSLNSNKIVAIIFHIRIFFVLTILLLETYQAEFNSAVCAT